MRGDTTRPSIRPAHPGSRPTPLPVLVTVLALVVGCAAPVPSESPSPADSPAAGTSPGPSPATSGAPASPTPTVAPDGDWVAGVELPPFATVAAFEPTRTTPFGVRADTAFRLTALDGSDPVALARLLVAEPPMDLDVRAADGATALVTPAEPLAAGGAYRFSLRGGDGTVRASWAVQALAPLEVAGWLPEEESMDVPVTTGIEVRFNQPGVAAADVERFLDIEPATPGRVLVEGRTAAFVPDRPLTTATLYTVTLRAGLPLADTGIELAEDAVLLFETSGVRPRDRWMRLARRLVDTTPRDAAVIPVNVDEGDWGGDSNPTPIGLSVHRLAGLDDAIAAWQAVEAAPDWSEVAGAPVDTTALPLVLDGEAPLNRFEDWNDWEQFLVLPARLEAGWYVVTLRPDGIPRQLVLQVTDLALYAMTTTTDTIAWVNDLRTGSPAAATVTVDGTRLGTTGSDGILVASTPPTVTETTAATAVVVARTGDAAVFATGGGPACEKCDGGGTEAPWWVAFTPDRWQYRSTDTINAWGIVRDRATGEVPDEVAVTLNAWSEWSDEGVSIDRVTARPDRNGAFAVQVPVSDAPYGSYELALRVDGEVIAAPWIEVSRILKPAWTLSLATSRHAAIEGQSVDVTAEAAFFEGTPVAGAEIRLRSDRKAGSLVTDRSGTGTAPVTLRLDGNWSQWEMVGISGRPVLPEEGDIGGWVEVAVFQAAVLLRSEPVVRDGRLHVRGSVHEAALERFEAPGAMRSDVDPFGRRVPGAAVRVKVVEHRSERIEAGTRYDWITKQVVPRYEYRDRKAVLGTWTVTTDSRGRFDLTLPAMDGRSYEVKLATTDGAGRTTTIEPWAEAEMPSRATSDPTITGDMPELGYSVGDAVRLRFEGGTGHGKPARYLWTTAQAGLHAWEITSGPAWTHVFAPSDVPGYVVYAVRFTGTGYVGATYQRSVPFAVQDRRLDVTVTTDRARYRPGDTAAVTIRTTGQDGTPVAASVRIMVIDEKLVAMGAVSEVDPLAPLYEAVGSGILAIALTHPDLRPVGDGGGGDTTGGGGESPRSDFRDWLVARLAHTGSDGTARITVALPDDLTSWHVFASGVTRSLLAGQGHASIAVSIPFFAELTVAESYLVADRPVVRLRAYGAGLDAGETVTFTVSSPTLPLAATTVTALAFRAAEVRLPALTAGTHRLRVEAVAGSGSGARRDALVRTFRVVASRAVATTVTRTALDGPMDVPSGDGFTTVVLADGGRGRVVPLLEEIAAAQPVRGDRALAAGVAARTLREEFGAETPGNALGWDLSPFTSGGSFTLLPYGGESLELSVMAALSGDPRVGNPTDSFAWREASTREASVWILAGLAAGGGPVLREIREAAALDDLTPDEQVALAVAALAAGDEPLAASLERDVLRDHGERYGPWVRLAVGGSEDEATVLTARLAIVAASLGEAVAADLDAYLEANPPRTTILDLERALAARGWARRVPPADAAAVLTVDGERRELEIRASEPVRLVLTPAQARVATLEPLRGSVVVAIESAVPLDPSRLERPGWLNPVRTVSPTGDVGIADTVVVTLRMSRPTLVSEGCWAVTEWVPSGLVPIAGFRGEDEAEDDGQRVAETVGPWNVAGQRLDFCLDPDRRGRQVALRYVARVVTPGTYAWEPAVIQSSLDPSVGTTVPGPVLVIRGER